MFYDFCLDDHVPADHQLRGIDLPSENEVILEGGTIIQPVSQMHNDQIFHGALLAIVEPWAPDAVEANCGWHVQRQTRDLSLRPAWMRYPCPALAKDATQPPTALVEHLPNGGSLLSATDETFDVDDP